MTTPVGRIGVSLHEPTVPDQLAAIELAERCGVPALWLIGGPAEPMIMLTAAAGRTSRIKLGTAIVPIFPRHPLTLAQQAVTLAALAPGRLRLGVGTSHRSSVEDRFGIPFQRPLEYQREFVTILKRALQVGPFDFEGRRFRVHGSQSDPPNVPVLISALGPRAYRLAGELTDGAISWNCPLEYLRDRALPALREGAAEARRDPPPLVAQCYLALGADAAAARAALESRSGALFREPFYQEMLVQAGFPEARDEVLTDRLLAALVAFGDEDAAARRLREYLTAGADEVIATVLADGPDRRATLERALRLVGAL